MALPTRARQAMRNAMTDVALGDYFANSLQHLSGSSSEVVVNEDSADVNFRVESNGNANAIFVDAGNDRVGILNASPSVALDVTGAIAASTTITAGTGLTITAGNVTVTAGDVVLTAGDVTLADAQDVVYGTGADAKMRWSTGDADNHALVIAVGDTSQALHITDLGAIATDWNVSANTHPNLYIHSNTTPATDYVRIGDHDGTEADIDVVGGTSLALKLAGTEYASVRTTGLSIGTYVAPATAGTDHLTIKSTGTAPAGTGANVGHIFCDFETDDDELFYLSGTVGTSTQLTT